MPIAAAKRNRAAGFIVLFIGFCAWFVFLVRNGLAGLCCRFDTEMPFPFFMKPPAHLKRFVEMEDTTTKL